MHRCEQLISQEAVLWGRYRCSRGPC